jgi:chitodextrinase
VSRLATLRRSDRHDAPAPTVGAGVRDGDRDLRLTNQCRLERRGERDRLSGGAIARRDDVGDSGHNEWWTTGYSNTGLQAGTTYRYRVVATNAGGDSPPSAVATATTPAAVDTIPPTAPKGLKAASPKGKVNLSWTGSTDTGGSGLAGYRIWRSTTGASGSFAVIGTTAGTLFTDSTVVAKQDYWYQVTAYDVAGNQSQLSNVALASPK